MDRRSVIRTLTAAAGVALVGLALTTCSNPIDILNAIITEVKVANNKFLVIADMGPFAQNDQNVNPGTTVWVEFDRDLDPASIGPLSVEFVPPATWTSDYNPTTRTLTIFPVSLESLTTYTVTIGGGLKGADGSDLQVNSTFSFKTKQAPSGTMTINAGGAYTTNPNVTLNFTYNAATTEIRWSTVESNIGDTAFTGSAPWNDKGPSFPLNLVNDGTYVIYYQLRDLQDNVTSGYNADPLTHPLKATVVVDHIPPVVGGFTIENSATYAASTAVTLYNNVTDATSPMEMHFQNLTSTWSAWENYSATKAWSLRAAGTRVVNAEFRDKAGNTIAAPVSDSIVGGAPTMYSYLNYHAIADFSSIGVWWSVTAPDAGTDTYYVSYRTHSPVGSWTFSQSTATIPTASVPLIVPAPSAETMYDFAVQIGNANAGAYVSASAPYSNATLNFTSNIVIVYNDGDKADPKLALALETVLKNTDGWMGAYKINGVLPPKTVTLVPQSFVSSSTKLSVYNRIYGYPLIVTPGVTNWKSPDWVWNVLNLGNGVIAMGQGGASMLDTINTYWIAKPYAYGAKGEQQPIQIGLALSRPIDGSDNALAMTKGNTVWTVPLYWSGAKLPIPDGDKVPTGKTLLQKVSAYLPRDPDGGAVYSRESGAPDYAIIARQGRFLQYGYYGLAGTGYPYYSWPLWVNLVDLMSIY